MTTSLDVFKILPFTKSEQASFADQIIMQIVEGYVDPMAVDLRLKAMEETLALVRGNAKVKEITLEEAEKYGKFFELEGVKIEVKSRTTNDFAGIDPVLDDLYNQLAVLKEMIKAREATVKAGVNPETGESFAPVKSSTTTFLTYKFK